MWGGQEIKIYFICISKTKIAIVSLYREKGFQVLNL